LQVNAASVAKDGIAEVHLRVVLNSAGGSLGSGNIKRLNLQNLSPSTVLATALKDNLNNVKLALVPFITLGEKVEARLNVFTTPEGDFDIDSVPKGAYLLQAAGATLYFNEEFKIARWNPKITEALAEIHESWKQLLRLAIKEAVDNGWSPKYSVDQTATRFTIFTDGLSVAELTGPQEFTKSEANTWIEEFVSNEFTQKKL
jgi:hypothetical protein